MAGLYAPDMSPGGMGMDVGRSATGETKKKERFTVTRHSKISGWTWAWTVDVLFPSPLAVVVFEGVEKNIVLYYT